MTLWLLVRTFQESGTFDQGARSLFVEGAAQLLAEPDPQRHTARSSTLDQRMAIAERAAAALLLSGRRTVFVGPDLAIGPMDLRASVLVGGHERTSAGPFEVNLDLVRDTLSTPMFSGRGDDRLRAQPFQPRRVLAARYLRRHEPPRRQLEDLFLVAGPDGSCSIPVPLRETAAWMAALDPRTGVWMAAADPQSLVGHCAFLLIPTTCADSWFRRCSIRRTSSSSETEPGVGTFGSRILD